MRIMNTFNKEGKPSLFGPEETGVTLEEFNTLSQSEQGTFLIVVQIITSVVRKSKEGVKKFAKDQSAIPQEELKSFMRGMEPVHITVALHHIPVFYAFTINPNLSPKLTSLIEKASIHICGKAAKVPNKSTVN